MEEDFGIFKVETVFLELELNKSKRVKKRLATGREYDKWVITNINLKYQHKTPLVGLHFAFIPAKKS